MNDGCMMVSSVVAVILSFVIFCTTFQSFVPAAFTIVDVRNVSDSTSFRFRNFQRGIKISDLKSLHNVLGIIELGLQAYIPIPDCLLLKCLIRKLPVSSNGRYEL